MLYKLIAAAAIIGLSAAAPTAETAAPALEPEGPTADEREGIDRMMLTSLIAQLQQKVNRYEALALKEGVKFETAPVSLRIDGKETDPKQKCLNKAKLDYFGCLEANCLTTQCEQKEGNKEPFNGRKEWNDKTKAPPGWWNGENPEGTANQALASLADTLMAQAEQYEGMLLERTPQEAVTLSGKPSMRTYWMNWGRSEAICIGTYNNAVKDC